MKIRLHNDANATIWQLVAVSRHGNLAVANRLCLILTLRQRRHSGEGKLTKPRNVPSGYLLNFGRCEGRTHERVRSRLNRLVRAHPRRRTPAASGRTTTGGKGDLLPHLRAHCLGLLRLGSDPVHTASPQSEVALPAWQRGGGIMGLAMGTSRSGPTCGNSAAGRYRAACMVGEIRNFKFEIC